MKNLLQHNQEKIQQIRKLLLEGRRKGYSRYTSYCWKVGERDTVDTQAIVGR